MSDGAEQSDDKPLNWVYKNNKAKCNYTEINEGQVIQFEPSSHHCKYCYDTWMQLDTPVKQTAVTKNFKTRIIDVGKGVGGTEGIKIGIAFKMNLDNETLEDWKKCILYYNTMNGGIYYKGQSPIQFLDRCEESDVVEWEITCSNIEQGLQYDTAQLKINGNSKGNPVILKEFKDLYPTLCIASSQAKVETGYHDMEYPKRIEGNFNVLSLYLIFLHSMPYYTTDY